jgi:tetratricopeptide (TPR) repeat protein
MFVLPVLLLVCVLAVAALARKKQPLVIMGLVWAAVTIAPTLDLRVFYWREIVHDRYLYIPSIGLALAMAVAVAPLARCWSEAGVRYGTLAVALLLAAVTAQQSVYWTTPLLLYSHAVETAPENVGANFLLAQTLEGRGDVADAVRFYEKSAMLAPRWVDPQVALSRLYARTGQRELAIAHMQQAVRIAPVAALQRELQSLEQKR